MPTPDPIDLPLLRRLLAGRWAEIDLVAETGSTNADLTERVRGGEAAGRVLITDFQSAGRGRRGRVWTAPPGSGIAMSVSLAPQVDPGQWTWLPLLTGLAVLEGIEQATGASVPLELKWPNDVLSADHKLCGILAERIERPSGPVAVVGMGINVALSAEQLPVPTATSLALLLGDRRPGRTQVIGEVLRRLAELVAEWETGGDPAPAYLKRCSTVGRTVRVQLAGDRAVHGRATGIDSQGCLIVATSSGPVVVGAGDVIHVR